MNASDIIAYVCESEIVCRDCGSKFDDEDGTWPIFADNFEVESIAWCGMHCGSFCTRCTADLDPDNISHGVGNCPTCGTTSVLVDGFGFVEVEQARAEVMIADVYWSVAGVIDDVSQVSTNRPLRVFLAKNFDTNTFVLVLSTFGDSPDSAWQDAWSELESWVDDHTIGTDNYDDEDVMTPWTLDAMTSDEIDRIVWTTAR